MFAGMHHLHLTTPVGTLVLTSNSLGRIARTDWLPYTAADSASLPETRGLPSITAGAIEALGTYFSSGEPMDPRWIFNEALDGSRWTDFQREVYRAVMEIPHGETRTYAWVARKLRRPGATRAVGQALRRNEHLILVPCHRVVASQDLGGFMGADDPSAPELQFKQRLLSWEHSWRNPEFSFFGRTA